MVNQDVGKCLRVFEDIIQERLDKYLYSIKSDEAMEEMKQEITKATEDFLMENPGFCEYANKIINRLPNPESLCFTISAGEQLIYINAKNPHYYTKKEKNKT